jgi:hypothetical protein
MRRLSTSHILNMRPTQSSQQVPLPPTTRNYVPPTLLLARHGTPPRWFSPSHVNNLAIDVVYYSILANPPKVSTPSISAP